jgi:hypothetical protein
VKRFVLVLTGLAALLLAACAPSAQVATNVVPTLISVNASGGEVVLQGRWFGGGHEGSHVVVAANVDGDDGTMVDVTSWSPTRIVFQAPDGLAAGFVFVVVDGIASNGLPADLN